MDNLNNTTQLADPIFDLAVAQTIHGRDVYFAARGSGLYSSNDSVTWNFALDALNLEAPLTITSVELAPNFVEMPHVFAAGPGGILRSKDGGETWQVTMLPSPPPNITDLVISPNYAQDGIIFASTLDDGIFRSSDRGANWTAWNFGLFDIHILSIEISPNFAEDRNIFLGTESGIFHSINGGLGWREVDFDVANAPVLSLAVSPDFSEDQILYAGTEESGMFYSNDRGRTWQLVELDHPVGTIHAVLLSADFPKDPNMAILNEENVLVSRDQGQTWQPWQTNLKFDDQILTMIAPEGISPEAKLFVGLANGEILKI